MTIKVNEDKEHAGVSDESPRPAQEESIAFKAGRTAREQGIPIRQSALRALRPGTRQYEDFIDGYDSAKRNRQR